MECPKCHEDALEYDEIEELEQRGYGQPGYDMSCHACGHQWKGHPDNVEHNEETS